MVRAMRRTLLLSALVFVACKTGPAELSPEPVDTSNTAANFSCLATGKRPWKDPHSNDWVNKRAYDGTTFHRIIKGFMIQGGDPLGSGRGEPGYVIKDELWTGAKHDKPGLLCMANR